MSNTVKHLFLIKELRDKLLFTLGILALFRLGVQIPCPGINPNALMNVFGQASQSGFLALLNLFSGGAMSQFSLFALGIMPYISASIIMQLLKVVVPSLETLSKEGAYGQRKIEIYTKYGTIVLCIIQSIGLLMLLKSQVLARNHPDAALVLGEEGLSYFFIFTFILTMTTGTLFLLWMGDRISERGIGNGVSLLIFSGIVARLPQSFLQLYGSVQEQPGNIIIMMVILIIFIIVMGFVVAEQKAMRKVPVQYAKRIVGRRVYGSQATYIPFKVNPSGVIPIIFASSVILFPSQLIGLFGSSSPVMSSIANSLSPGHMVYMITYMLFVIFFAYFYTAVYFNPLDISNRLKKEGGFIPGIRPGANTRDYLARILNRITLPGSIFLGFVAIFPDIIINMFSSVSIPRGFAYLMGGTSLLIMVGVGLDTVKQIESQLLTKNVGGFVGKKSLKKRY